MLIVTVSVPAIFRFALKLEDGLGVVIYGHNHSYLTNQGTFSLKILVGSSINLLHREHEVRIKCHNSKLYSKQLLS